MQNIQVPLALELTFSTWPWACPHRIASGVPRSYTLPCRPIHERPERERLAISSSSKILLIPFVLLDQRQRMK